jgi:uncharacterized membrane protein
MTPLMKSRMQMAFLALVLAAIAQALWHHGRLPEKVASHFDGRGAPNGWMSRDTHTALQVATVLFVAALIEGIVALSARLPKEYINIPRRDYWLAPERAAATHARLGRMILAMGVALVIFFMAVFRLIYRANLLPDARLDLSIWYYTGALLAVVAVSIVATVKRFGRSTAA